MSRELRTAKMKKSSGGIKKSFTNKKFKSGAYSSFITILVIAIVVVVNLVFGKLDLSSDLSSNSLFTLSKDTKKALKRTARRQSILKKCSTSILRHHQRLNLKR